MDTNKIKVFVTAVNYGSLSKAAEEFGYTPSAMSHIIDSIENELGIKLLDRTYSGVKLTADGREIMRDMNEMLQAENQMYTRVEYLLGKRRAVRVGAFSSIANSFLPKIIKEFRTEYPNINISLNVASDRIMVDMKKNNIDLIISSDEYGSEFQWVPIMEDEYYAVFPTQLAPTKKTIKREELYNYSLFISEIAILKKNFDMSRFKETIVIKSEDFTPIMKMVKEGVGIAIVPGIVAKKSKNVKLVKIDPPLKRYLGIYYKDQSLVRKEVKLFFDYLIESLNKK